MPGTEVVVFTPPAVTPVPVEKPYRGRIKNWTKVPCDDGGRGLGYLIIGDFIDHPDYKSDDSWDRAWWRTSWVVKHDTATGEIETNNSRYTLEKRQ